MKSTAPFLLSLLLSACVAPPAGPSPAVTSAARRGGDGAPIENPTPHPDGSGIQNPIPPGARGRAGNAGLTPPPTARDYPPPPITRTPPNPNFDATAFEAGGSAPGIRAQYETSAAAYRQVAAQSPSPQREQYLEAARQLDQQAAALGN